MATKQDLIKRYEILKRLTPKIYILKESDQKKITDYLKNPNIKQIKTEKTLKKNIQKIDEFIHIIHDSENKKLENNQSVKNEVVKANNVENMMRSAGIKPKIESFAVLNMTENTININNTQNIQAEKQTEYQENEQSYEELIKSYDEILNSLELLLNIKNAKNLLDKKQAELDAKTQDILHFIEFTEIENPFESHTIIQTIKNIRLERRKVKDLLSIFNLTKDINLNEIKTTIQRKRTYAPRVYKDLFDKMKDN